MNIHPYHPLIDAKNIEIANSIELLEAKIREVHIDLSTIEKATWSWYWLSPTILTSKEKLTWTVLKEENCLVSNPSIIN